jgi:kynurenine formamidase
MLRAMKPPPMLPLIAAVVLGGCTPIQALHSHPKPKSASIQRCVPPRQTVVDLTHPMHPDMPFWPGGVAFEMERLVDYDQGYRFHRFSMGENTGTHVDAPSHFAEGKRSIERLAVDELVVPLALLDVKGKVADDPDYLVSGADIVDWEAVHGPVPVGSLFVANTGWHRRFGDPGKYLNKDAEGVMHFPGYSLEAAKLLVERDVVGIGIDTLSIDHGPSKDFAVHEVVLAADKYMVENLANLDAVPELGATVVVGVLPVTEGSQAQARIIALVPEKTEGEEEGTAPEEEEVEEEVEE